MDLEEIPEGLRYRYIKRCICERVHEIMTQDYNDPEYDTEVFLPCPCGQWIDFLLPVN